MKYITYPNGFTQIVEHNGIRGVLQESYCDGVSKVRFDNSYEFVKTSELTRFKPEEL